MEIKWKHSNRIDKNSDHQVIHVYNTRKFP